MCLPVSLATSHLRLRSQLTLPSRGFVHQDHRISKDMVREREKGVIISSVLRRLRKWISYVLFFKMSGILVAHNFYSTVVLFLFNDGRK